MFPIAILAPIGPMVTKAYLSYYRLFMTFSPFISESLFFPYYFFLSSFIAGVSSFILIQLIGFTCWLAFLTPGLTSVILPSHYYQNDFSYLQKMIMSLFCSEFFQDCQLVTGRKFGIPSMLYQSRFARKQSLRQSPSCMYFIWKFLFLNKRFLQLVLFFDCGGSFIAALRISLVAASGSYSVAV